MDDIGFHAHKFIGRKGFRPLGSEDGHLTTFFSKRLSELIGIISHATNIGGIRGCNQTDFQNSDTILSLKDVPILSDPTRTTEFVDLPFSKGYS